MCTARSATPCALCRATGRNGHPGVNVQISLEFREVGALSNFCQADHIKRFVRKSAPHTYPWLVSLLHVAHQSGLGRTRNIGASAALVADPQTDMLRDVNGAQGTHARIPPGHLRVDGMRMCFC